MGANSKIEWTTHTFNPWRGCAKLAAYLAEFSYARVVIRFGDHPLIRELYPESDGWRWIFQQGRKQSNGVHDEVLIINGESFAA